MVKPSTNNGGGISGFLRDKTGVTGPWMLGTGVAAYCLSKEVYVITSEVCRSWSLLFLFWLVFCIVLVPARARARSSLPLYVSCDAVDNSKINH